MKLNDRMIYCSNDKTISPSLENALTKGFLFDLHSRSLLVGYDENTEFILLRKSVHLKKMRFYQSFQKHLF